MHVSQEKTALREAMKERLQRLSETEREAESRSLCRRLLENVPSGTTVCAYAAMRNEAQLDLFIKELLKQGATLYLPRFERNDLVFRQCKRLESLIKGPLGVREPPADAALLPPDAPHLSVIVPGVAFDRKGYRLGRGNGGYDRWIAPQRRSHPSTRFIGAALSCQLVDSVPVEPHDERMNALVTAREFLQAEGDGKTGRHKM